MEGGPIFPHIEVLRLGHRPQRDKRITTHVSLVARALGARGIHVDTRDAVLENTIERVNRQFGGDFFVRTGISPRGLLHRWNGTIVHLTMYGMPLEEAVSEIPREEDILVVIGAEKVPREVYDLSHFNVSVANQPHSEVSALALFLDRIFMGKELDLKMPGAELMIEPSRKGKSMVPSNSGSGPKKDLRRRQWPSIPDPHTCIELMEFLGCSKPVITHVKVVRDLGMEMVRSSRELHPERHLDMEPSLLEAGLLLHDIGRSVTHSISHITHGVRLARRLGLDERLVRMIHNHIGAGVTASEAVALGLPEEDHIPETLMEMIVCHADSLVGDRKRRTLSEAAGKLREKGAEVGAERMHELHSRLEDVLGIDIDRLIDPSLKDY